MHACRATVHALCMGCLKHPPLVRRGCILGTRAPLHGSGLFEYTPGDRSEQTPVIIRAVIKNELSSEKLRGTEGM